MKTIILLNGQTQAEVENSQVKIFVEWDLLRAAIEKAVMLRPGEMMEGYVIDDKGISVSICRIRGRKVQGFAGEEQ